MKRYIIPILLCALLLTGCKVTVDDAGSLNGHFSFPNEESSAVPTPTGPTAPTNPYGPVDFGFDGTFLTCESGDYRIGIDVSEWQDPIDWQQIKAAGVEYVILRIGQRGNIEGVLFEDACFRSHYDSAVAAGLDVGCYFFSQAVSPEEALAEAEYALELLDGRALQMPLFFDWEHIKDEYRTVNMDARTLTDCVKAFCDRVKAAGYDSGVYFNPDVSQRLLYLGELTEYRFWLAMYGADMTFPYKFDMWQYTNQGRIPGIEGDVDLNIQLIYENGGTENE